MTNYNNFSNGTLQDKPKAIPKVNPKLQMEDNIKVSTVMEILNCIMTNYIYSREHAVSHAIKEFNLPFKFISSIKLVKES